MVQPDPSLSPPIDRRVPFAVGLVAFVVYLCTMYPGVTGGDSGQLITAAASGGVIHPPGFPLYALLGRIFAHLPFGGLAWRFNLFSALCDAAAAGTLCAAVTVWSRSQWTGVLAAGLFAFCPGIWSYAICAEVFALNNLLVAVLLLLGVLWERTGERRYILAGAFAFGLGLSNHQVILFAGAPVVLWALWVHGDELLKARELSLLAGCFAIGLLPYLYLPLAGEHVTPYSWGAVQTWSGFWSHVLRREYGTFRLGAAHGLQSPLLDIVGDFVAYVRAQLSLAGVAIAVIGLVTAARGGFRTRAGFIAIAVAPPLLTVGVFCVLADSVVSSPVQRELLGRFWEQPTIYCCAWCALGTSWLVARFVQWRPAPMVAAIGGGLLELVANVGETSRRDNRIVERCMTELLREAPPNAMVLVRGDMLWFATEYVQMALGVRADVVIVDQDEIDLPWARARLRRTYPQVKFAESGQLRPLVDANFDAMPIVACSEKDHTLDDAYELHAFGLCGLLVRRGAPITEEEWLSRREKALPHLDFRGQAHPEGSWEDGVWGTYWTVHQTYANDLMTFAGHDPARRPWLEKAVEVFGDLARNDPTAEPREIKKYAQAIHRLGDTSLEDKAREADAWRRYLAVAPKSDPQIPAIEKELRKIEAR